MFKLSQSDSFWWPIEVEFAADGGKFVRESFDAQFKRLSKSQVQELLATAEKSDDADRAFVQSVLVGWKGITDNGEPVPFSQSALEQLLEIPRASAAIVVAYMDALKGRTRKNG